MMGRKVGTLLAGCALAALVGCQEPVADVAGEPVPVSFLQERLRRAIGHLDAARATRPGDSAGASARLADARLLLRRLDEYYLPLLAARDQVARALESADSGESAALPAVDSAEAVLLGIVRGHGPHLQDEMREPLERVEDIRTALAAGNAEETRQLLLRLHHHIESIFFRGELVLQESELDR